MDCVHTPRGSVSVANTCTWLESRNEDIEYEDIDDIGAGPFSNIDLFFPPLTSPISQATHSRPPAPMFPRFLRHHAQLPTCPTSPEATRTHPIQSSDICGRVARPATNQADFLTPVDVAPAVHPDDPSTGPSAQPRRHPVHSHSRPANCHTSAPPVRHHWAGSLAPFWL